MKTLIKNIGFYCCLIIAFSGYSQIICQETKEKITLKNGNSVYVYQEKNASNSPIYYYVPIQLNVSKSKEKPEYSFQEYKDSKTGATGGAILHLLITWGLDSNERNELSQQIKKRHGNNARLSGAIYLDNKHSRVIITANTPLGQILNKSLKSKGAPPTLSSSKMALSFMLKKRDVEKVKNAIQSPSKFSKTVLKINYSFNTNTCKSSISLAKKNNINVVGQLQKWF